MAMVSIFQIISKLICHEICNYLIFRFQVSMTHPAAVTACNLDLENLITDSNRSIATLAITTLLKTGSESSVDRLMKQIATFVNEISDEFKVNILIFYYIYFSSSISGFHFDLKRINLIPFVCFKYSKIFFSYSPLRQLSSKSYLNSKPA